MLMNKKSRNVYQADTNLAQIFYGLFVQLFEKGGMRG